MKRRSWLFILAFLSMLALAACTTAPAITPSPTLQPTQPPVPIRTETPRPSNTPAPTNTLPPSPVPTGTWTATMTVVPTSTSTPRPSFAGFKVEYADYTNYGLLLAMQVPGIKENYRLDVNGVEYKCNLYEKQPDHIFCYGPQFPPNTEVKLAFLPLKDGTDPLFQATYKIVPFATPTVDPRTIMAANPANCPVRGINVKCETEYRRLGGGYCIVATCVDTCGYYYSVQTCPPDMTLEGVYTFTGTPPFPGTPDAPK